MTGLQRAERREFRRYRAQVPAALITQAGESAPCTILDISWNGASISCGLIKEHIGLELRLEGFGTIKVARLRAKRGAELLLFRDSDGRCRQFMQFLINLVDAGAALPTSDRQQPEPRNEPDSPLACFNDALPLQVDRALAFIAQRTTRNFPDNVVLFGKKAETANS